MKFIVTSKYKKIITNILIFSLIFFLLINSKLLVKSISTSSNIFITKLIPALFPYLLITELLINSDKVNHLAYGLDNIISTIFHIPKVSTSCVIIGFILGYPNAAKCILKLYQDRLIDSKTATKLISFTSNANISYIIATVGIGIFRNIEIGIILAISHYLSAIIIGIIYRPSYTNSIIQQTNANSNSFRKIYSPFELLSISISGALKTLAYIFSYTVIFSLVPTILLDNIYLPELLKTCIIGFFEISNGINSISLLDTNLSYKLFLVSFVLSFSSFMILMQIYAFAFKANVKFKNLFKFKIIQGVLSSIITHIIVSHIYAPTLPVFYNQDIFSLKIHILPSTIYMFALFITSILSLFLFRKKRQE